MLRFGNHEGAEGRHSGRRLNGVIEFSEVHMTRIAGWVVAALATIVLNGCGYNTLQSQDEQIKAA